MWTGEYRSRSERVGCSDPGPQLARAGRARCRSRSERLFLVPAGKVSGGPPEKWTTAVDLSELACVPGSRAPPGSAPGPGGGPGGPPGAPEEVFGVEKRVPGNVF